MSGWVWRGPRAWLPWGRLLLLAAVVNLGVLALLVGLTTQLGFAPTLSSAPGGDPPGFLWGLWHGLLLPVAFVVSFFRPSVGLYAAVHDGHAYDAGFLLGAFVILHWPFARVTRTVHHHHHHHVDEHRAAPPEHPVWPPPLRPDWHDPQSGARFPSGQGGPPA